MGLDKASLKSGLKSLYDSARVGSGISDDAFADQMANLIDAYVKGADVTVSVTGVESGGSTAPGTGSLS